MLADSRARTFLATLLAVNVCVCVHLRSSLVHMQPARMQYRYRVV